MPNSNISRYVHFHDSFINYNISWDEMGKYDIPAMIDKILEVTGETKIFYVGHSMGTTGFMVMANERPEYQEYVHLANFLAPVAYVDHMKSPIRYLAPYINSVQVNHSNMPTLFS